MRSIIPPPPIHVYHHREIQDSYVRVMSAKEAGESSGLPDERSLTRLLALRWRESLWAMFAG